MLRGWRSLFLIACLLCLPRAAAAQGHMLHGIGPVNSSMGGAGVALPYESLGALTFNPALIGEAKGNQVTFATEFFRDGLRIGQQVGSVSTTTNPTLQLGVIPAFGWMMRHPEKKVALGFGLIGVAGFRTDYPVEPAGLLLVPQPDGFGRIYTDYTLTKIPVAVAIQATPKLTIGGSFNLYRGTLAIQPLPVVTPDLGPSGETYLPAANNVIARWGASGQFGFVYKASAMVSLGASYQTYQKFQEYQWNSTNSNPESAQFGYPRTLTFRFDGPAAFTFGAALYPSAKTAVAIDGQFTKYDNVEGLGGPGGVDVANHRLVGIGWRNIWSFKAGLRHQVNDTLVIRAGYNFSQTPIRADIVETSMGTPATFQNHICGGVGIKMFPFLTADAGFYVVPRQHVKGPILSLQTGTVPGSELDMSNSITSFQVGFNFGF